MGKKIKGVARMNENWVVVLFNPITIYLMFIGLLLLLDSIGGILGKLGVDLD